METKQRFIVGSYYPELDGLRAVAIMLVFFMHAYAAGGVPETPFHKDIFVPMQFGWIGVDFFFVLSGFLITGILIDTQYENGFLRTFYVRRTLRIFPLYYLVLLTYITTNSVFGYSDVSNTSYFLYIFYLTNWDEFLGFQRPLEIDHFWSLAIEEQFYVFWPVLFLFFSRMGVRSPQVFCLCIILTSITLRIFLTSYNFIFFAYDITPCRLDGLMAGSLLAFLLRSGYLRLNDVHCALILGLSIIFFVLIHNGHFSIHNGVVLSYGMPALPLVFGTMIAYVFLLPEDHLYRRILRTRIAVIVGKLSYGIYVYHWFVMILLNKNKIVPQDIFGYFGSITLFFILSLILTLAISALSFRYIEKPILGLKDKYAAYDDKSLK